MAFTAPQVPAEEPVLPGELLANIYSGGLGVPLCHSFSSLSSL